MSRSGYNQGTYLAGARDARRRGEEERAVTAAADASQAVAAAARVRAKLEALLIKKLEAVVAPPKKAAP